MDKNFIWGAATASYQIEGAWNVDGKGPNIWDEFTHQPQKIKDNSTGDVACDHYNRYKEDVKLMADLGLKAYRFSISWARILPEGVGRINQAGIDFYNNLIDELLKYNITPFITLYHWDLPYALYLKGGWLNPESSQWFYEYAKVVKENFGDRVKNFITFNEPSVFTGCGYQQGVHAPGLQLGTKDLLKIGHNILLSHGKAVKFFVKFQTLILELLWQLSQKSQFQKKMNRMLMIHIFMMVSTDVSGLFNTGLIQLCLENMEKTLFVKLAICFQKLLHRKCS